MKERNGYDRYLFFQYRRAGDFFTALFQAISFADTDNRRRIGKGFPDEVEAYLVWSQLGGVKKFVTKVSPDHPYLDHFKKEYNL